MLVLCGSTSKDANARKAQIENSCGTFIDGTVRPIAHATYFQRTQACPFYQVPKCHAHRRPHYQHVQPHRGPMSSIRASVEWCFGDILRYWPFLDYKCFGDILRYWPFLDYKNLKVILSPIAKLYLLGVLFTNYLTCERASNQTSCFFETV